MGWGVGRRHQHFPFPHTEFSLGTNFYIHTYMHACMRACMHACMHASMHTCIHTCIHTHAHINIRTYAYPHIRTNAQTPIRTYDIHIKPTHDTIVGYIACSPFYYDKLTLDGNVTEFEPTRTGTRIAGYKVRHYKALPKNLTYSGFLWIYGEMVIYDAVHTDILLRAADLDSPPAS